MKKLTCLECDKLVANTSNVLARHLRAVHDMEWADYVVKHTLGGQWPTCACGCGERLVWKKGGFGKYSKGHDSKLSTKLIVQAGWISNPFTGKEEHISSDDEIALLEHCLANNDPVTHDHGIKIAWEDSAGKLRFIIPCFKHLKKKLLLTIDSVSDVDYPRRLSCYKQWCDMHEHSILVLKRSAVGFDVVGAYKPKKGDQNVTEKKI